MTESSLEASMKANQPFLAHFLFLLCLAVISHAVPAQEPATVQKPHVLSFTKDMTIYVSDFELDAENVQVDQGSAVAQRRPGVLERPQKKEQQNPQAQKQKLVDTLSQSIVSDLQKAGYKAQRLMPGDAKPAVGAWVHGVFTQADEGNRLQRAVIGFGSGQATMQLFVTLTDLASPQKPLYETSEKGTSKDKPGAAISMNPYVAAAKFVMEKNASEKVIKSTAVTISKDVVLHLSQ
jgi:hypothetical protein